MEATETTLESVRHYYGSVLQGTRDLRTSACCSTESLPDYVKRALAHVDEEIVSRTYGCGSPIPLALEGCTVLDLGCGTGRDVFVASQLAGPHGHVIGIDMTDEQLDVGRRHIRTHMDRFGLDHANVEFRKGYIEDLSTAGVDDASVDVVISNCVINLSPDKKRVFEEIFRVLKPGGELYFSDVFSDRRVSASVASDPVVYGECLGGALYAEDFRRVMLDIGIRDVRTTSSCAIELDDPEIRRIVGSIRFTSQTLRAFNLPELLEDRCEDYGQVAVYRGTIADAPHAFVLDDHHRFETGRPMLVCGNTAAMVGSTRYGQHFEVLGDRSVHFGTFDCAPAEAASGAACGC